LWISFWPGFQERTPKSLFSFEDRPGVILIPDTFELLLNTLHVWDMHRAQMLLLFIQIPALGINDRDNEILNIAYIIGTEFSAAFVSAVSC
jgi:hypothetical protein